jgi:hypothetical protein
MYNHCNIDIIQIYFCNIHLKQSQHTSETSETPRVFSTSQHVLDACEMEARRRVEFTRGSRAVVTIDQMDSAYYKADGYPFVAAGIVGSMVSFLCFSSA